MAVKAKEKLPTPSEVSGQPIKFTEGEINQITELQNKTQGVVFQLGQLTLSELQLEGRLEDVLSISKMEDMLKEGPESENFYNYQIYILQEFT